MFALVITVIIIVTESYRSNTWRKILIAPLRASNVIFHERSLYLFDLLELRIKIIRVVLRAPIEPFVYAKHVKSLIFEKNINFTKYIH